MSTKVSSHSRTISSRAIRIADRIDHFAGRFSWLKVSRLRAFVSHLTLSGAIVASVFAIVFLVWYPSPYFAAVGAWSIIRILIGVDLVLGPLLTLILFRPGKRLLLVDVLVIGVLQLSALTYGLSVLYEERPHFVVFALDRLHIFSEEDIPEDFKEMPAWASGPRPGPVFASAQRPTTGEAQQRLLEETVFGGAPDIERRPYLWIPMEDDVAEMKRRANPLSLLRAADPDVVRQVEELTRSLGRDKSQLGFFPIESKKNIACAIIDLDSGKLVSVLNFDPWQYVRR